MEIIYDEEVQNNIQPAPLALYFIAPNGKIINFNTLTIIDFKFM